MVHLIIRRKSIPKYTNIRHFYYIRGILKINMFKYLYIIILLISILLEFLFEV